jgi:hypothetical protein
VSEQTRELTRFELLQLPLHALLAICGFVAWLGTERGSPVPDIESPHSVAGRHPEIGHRVENPACELDLRPLAR